MKNMSSIPYVRSPHFQSFALLLVMATSCFNTGCQSRELAEIDDLQSSTVVSRGQDLGQTMKYIESHERFEMGEFRNKVNSGLNRWISNRPPTDDNWKLSDSVSVLPEEIKTNPVFTNLSGDRFSGNDAYYVQQCYWLEKIAERVNRKYTILNHEYFLQLALRKISSEEKEAWKSSADLLADVVATLNPQLGTDPGPSGRSEVQQLARAMELFDWTIRNIQLVESRPWPMPSGMDEVALVADADPNAWPPAVGAIGPGYVRYPWQTLTYGKGDFIDRAHVFALLCQASGIPVTILATPVNNGSRRPYTEWVPAVLIGGQLYLFDTLLGLPLPGKEPGSIATLSEVKSDPSLLSRLNLTPEESVERQDYRIDAGQLDDILALVVAEPESLSRRMAAVEGALTGESRIGLAEQPGQLIDELSRSEAIKRSELWHVPFSIALFREQIGLAVNKAQYDPDISDKLSWLPIEEIYIDNFVMFRTARNMYLRGIFESNRKSKIRSALSYYFAFMYSDEDISRIEGDPELQASLGIRKSAGQDVKSWRQQLAFMKNNMALIRSDAAFFMSLAHFELGNPQPALNWLDNQLPRMDNNGRWEPWRPYQRGRAFEAAGEYKAAEQAFEADMSAQRTGSLIRSRWMKELETLGNGS
jgi:hypothetical protein